MKTLKIEELSKNFGTTEVLRKINLEIDEGNFLVLLGPSGCGKSTLLNIIGGLDSPTEGQVSVLGQALNDTSHGERARLRRKHMGFIFQNYNLLPVYTVFENVELPLILNKIDRDKRRSMVEQAVESVGLRDKMDSRPNMLSGGECQRTAIARAIVHEPALIMADEPTGNLDSSSSKEIIKLIEELNKGGLTLVVVTHDKEMGRRSDRLIELLDGKIINDTKS